MQLMIAAEMLCQAAAKIGWKAFPSKRFFLMLGCLYQRFSESFADLLLEKAHVAVAPGKDLVLQEMLMFVSGFGRADASGRSVIADLQLFNN